MLGVPITLPNMALQASLYGSCSLHFIDYAITFNLKQSCDKLVYIWAILFKFNHSFAWKSMWQAVYELCCSGIKMAFNFKLKLVFIEKITGGKATCKLIQEATSNLKLK